MVDGIRAIWELIHGPNNDPIVVGLGLGWLGLLVGYIAMFWSNRKVLAEKDKRIVDLVNQRNTFQEIALAAKGIDRKSTDGPATKDKGKPRR